MPLDPSIPLSARGIQFRSPLERLMAVQQMDIQLENAEALAEQRRAMAAQREAAAEAQRRELATQTATGEAFRQGGGVRDKTLGWAQQNSPDLIPSLTEYFDKADERSNGILQTRLKLRDMEADLFGDLADGALRHGGSPESVRTALAYTVEKFPEYADRAAQIWKQVEGADDAGRKAILEGIRGQAPFYRAQHGKNTPQVIAPGGALVDDRGQVLYTAPAKVEAPAAGTFADFLSSYAQDKGRTVAQLSPTQKLQAKAIWESAGRAPTSDHEPLVAIMGPDDKPVLVPRSQAVGKAPASSREQGRAVTSGDAGRIADIDTSLSDLGVLRQVLTAPGSTGVESKVRASLPNWANELTSGWGSEAKQRQAVIDRVKQVIGKTLEGGVLRKEDEAKYARILPTIGDTADVAKAKIDGLETALKQRKSITLDALEDAGYETSRFRTRTPGAGGETGKKVGRFEIVGVK